MNNQIVEEILRIKEIMMSLLTEAPVAGGGGEGPITLLKKFVSDLVGIGETRVSKYFGEEFAESLENKGIRSLKDLDDDLSLIGREADQITGELKLSKLTTEEVSDLANQARRTMLTNPNLGWLAEDNIDEAFSAMNIPDVLNVYKYALNLDPTVPKNQDIINRIKVILKKRTGVDDFGNYMDNYHQGKLNRQKPAPKTPIEEPVPPAKPDGETPTTTDAVDETPITPDNYSEEVIENFVQRTTTDERITAELSNMSDSELKVKSQEVYKNLKNKNINDWTAEDWAYYSQLGDMKMFTQSQMDEMIARTPEYAEYKQILKSWEEYKKSPEYKSLTSGTQTVTTTVGGKTTTVTKNTKAVIITFEKFLANNGIKKPSWWVRVRANLVSYLDSVFNSYKLLPKLGEPGFGKAWAKFAFHFLLAVGSIVGGAVALVRTGTESGIKYLSDITNVTKVQLRSAVIEFFNYDSPKINGTNIYGDADAAANADLKSNPPEVANILNEEEGIVQLTKPVSVDGKQYKVFKVKLNLNLLRDIPLIKSVIKYPHELFTTAGGQVTPTSNYDKGKDGFKKFIKDKYNQDFTNAIEDGNMYYQDQDAKDIGKGWEFIPDTQGSTKGTYQSKTN